jgi:hypothetical protein
MFRINHPGKMKIRYINALSMLCFLMLFTSANAQQLDSLFKNPPATSKPYVWWHWMGSNFSKAGITKDLEAMKEQGIGGATIFNLASAVQESYAPTLNNPWPEQTYRSAAYWEALKFAASEADRLGLEIGLHNSPGYSTTGGPWIDQQRGMQKLVWRKMMVRQQTAEKITIEKPESVVSEGWGSLVLPRNPSTWYQDIAYLAIPQADSLHFTSPQDFTSYFNTTGNQIKSFPKGDWIIYRFGYAATMAIPHPLPDDIIGKTYEADKMSREQSKYHWKNVLEPLKSHLGEYLGKSFKHVLIDSYEAGYQNWTPEFRKEFISRKGYDPLPWLPTFTAAITNEYKSAAAKEPGRIRFDEDQTKRFEWDYHDVISQLYFDNGWTIGKQALHDAGLQFQWEPYEGPFNTVEGAAFADVPMGEFWSDSRGNIDGRIPAAASASGKRIVGAESFTGAPGNSKYTEDPASLKPAAVGAFASGVNRLILHHWVHQPFDDQYQPGMGMGWWGTHFGRYQTWAEPGKAFFQFLARSQVLLQYGQRVSDYLCVEELQGNADLISTRDFLKEELKVRDGSIVLPSGRSYPFVVFPAGSTMLPETLQKIKLLLSKGATVVASKPSSSPSLRNYPSCDATIKEIAAALWEAGELRKPVERLLPSIGTALKLMDIQPDYQVESGESVTAIHRTGDQGEVYYLANMRDKPRNLLISFRQKNLQPELWNAEDGTRMAPAVWNQHGNRTYVNLSLNDFQSVFVVLRKPTDLQDHAEYAKVAGGKANIRFATDGQGSPFITSSEATQVSFSYTSGKTTTLELKAPSYKAIDGSWKVQLYPKLGTQFSVLLPDLKDFSKHDDPRIAYFAGSAVYKKEVSIGKAALKANQQVLLDLGTLNDIVSVKVNGKSLGVFWYPPYVVNVTDVVKPGINSLEITVTNNWANRLIGDEQMANDFEWGGDRGENGRAMKAYPDWFIKHNPRPSNRKAFTVWYYYRKDSKLVPAGLAGPVRLIFEDAAKL